MVAALAYAEAEGLNEENTVRLSIATGAANVMCSGTQAAERSQIEELLPLFALPVAATAVLDQLFNAAAWPWWA